MSTTREGLGSWPCAPPGSGKQLEPSPMLRGLLGISEAGPVTFPYPSGFQCQELSPGKVSRLLRQARKVLLAGSSFLTAER